MAQLKQDEEGVTGFDVAPKSMKRPKTDRTAEGELFVARSREILASIEAAEAEITAASQAPRGHLRISVGTAYAKQTLGPLLPLFLARYPQITVELLVSDRQIDLVAEQADLAIRSGWLGDSTLIARKITDARRLICASPLYLKKYCSPRVPAAVGVAVGTAGGLAVGRMVELSVRPESVFIKAANGTAMRTFYVVGKYLKLWFGVNRRRSGQQNVFVRLIGICLLGLRSYKYFSIKK
jgi:hypothetical protein